MSDIEGKSKEEKQNSFNQSNELVNVCGPRIPFLIK
jgi:hypothetical protein